MIPQAVATPTRITGQLDPRRTGHTRPRSVTKRIRSTPSPAKKQRTAMISQGSTDTERTKKPPVLKQSPEMVARTAPKSRRRRAGVMGGLPCHPNRAGAGCCAPAW